jgi:uncharacterized protein (DUF433 family)
MSIVQEIEVSKMSRSEKVKLLQILVRDLSDEFEGIEKTEGVCGGSARIRQTRIPVWVLENARRYGVSESELLQDYPTLTAQDLANAWTYARSNREEIEREIAENEGDED